MVRRGEVWLCALDPTVGSEIRKTRPWVIMVSIARGEHINAADYVGHLIRDRLADDAAIHNALHHGERSGRSPRMVRDIFAYERAANAGAVASSMIC